MPPPSRAVSAPIAVALALALAALLVVVLVVGALALGRWLAAPVAPRPDAALFPTPTLAATAPR